MQYYLIISHFRDRIPVSYLYRVGDAEGGVGDGHGVAIGSELWHDGDVMKRLKPLVPIRLTPIRLKPIFDEGEDGIGDVSLYERAACRGAGVPYYKEVSDKKVYHFVGHFEIQSADEAVDEVVLEYRQHLRENAQPDIFNYLKYVNACSRLKSIEGDIEREEKWYEEGKIQHDEYEHRYKEWAAKDDEKRGAAPHLKGRVKPRRIPDIDRSFATIHQVDVHTADREGYIYYLAYVAFEIVFRCYLQSPASSS